MTWTLHHFCVGHPHGGGTTLRRHYPTRGFAVSGHTVYSATPAVLYRLTEDEPRNCNETESPSHRPRDGIRVGGNGTLSPTEFGQ